MGCYDIFLFFIVFMVGAVCGASSFIEENEMYENTIINAIQIEGTENYKEILEMWRTSEIDGDNVLYYRALSNFKE